MFFFYFQLTNANALNTLKSNPAVVHIGLLVYWASFSLSDSNKTASVVHDGSQCRQHVAQMHAIRLIT